MAQLPSGYKYLSALALTTYLNTGVNPSDDLEIDFLFSGDATMTGGYLFGARNSNSNTSAGQYNLYYTSGGTSYFGYRSARVNLGSFTIDGGLQGYVPTHFYGLNNSMQWNTGNNLITNQGATGTFTGTRTMYLGGLNNAGSVSNALNYCVHALSIKQGGTLVRNYIPCVYSNAVGLYDTVNGTFTALSTSRTPYAYLVTINDNTGGTGFAKTWDGELTKEIYCGGSGFYVKGYSYATLVASAEDGYEFQNWTDGNGNVVSEKAEFSYKPTTASTLTPNFRKIANIDLNMNYQLKVYEYGTLSIRHETVAVRSASVKTDALQKTSSTFELESVPSTLIKNSIVSLHSPKGKQLYIGVVNAIEGNTITCREAMSIYDREYVFSQSAMPSGNALVYSLESLMQRADYSNFVVSGLDNLLHRRFTNTMPLQSDNTSLNAKHKQLLSPDHANNPNFTIPALDQTETKNLEDYLFEMFNDYGIYIDVAESDTDKSRIEFYPFYYKLGENLTISNNYEDVTDVEVVVEDQEANVLVLYNSTGATQRGIYASRTDGSTEEVVSPYTNYLAYTDYKSKVVMSDDNVIDVINQNLSNAHLNHKITFNVALGGLYRAEDFYIGRPIQFYVGDKLYQSVITSVAFDIAENQERIIGAKITIGKVRTNLTSKLNLGKVK